MPLPRLEAKVPKAIRCIEVRLVDTAAVVEGEVTLEPARQEIMYLLEIMQSDGSVHQKRGDLAEHLTDQQRDSLLAFLSHIRARVESEMLPQGG